MCRIIVTIGGLAAAGLIAGCAPAYAKRASTRSTSAATTAAARPRTTTRLDQFAHIEAAFCPPNTFNSPLKLGLAAATT